jgi:hypothetical protein
MGKRRVRLEYSPSMLEPVCPGVVSPDRALCSPTLSHFLIVNKTSLSLSLAPHVLIALLRSLLCTDKCACAHSHLTCAHSCI